ncbi:MAG: SHOCT domain-containing protein [Anaerolineales bacterium]
MVGHGMWGCCGGLFGGMGGWGIFGPIVSLVFTLGLIIGFVLLVIWAVRRLSSGSAGSASQIRELKSAQTPLEILNTRYARGEITRDEYQEMKADLR